MLRREFIQAAAGGGAALAAGLGDKSANRLIPSVEPPPIPPGVWTRYVTTCRECPAGCGLYARTIDGRAIACEGNPDHPINRGALCPRGQSAPQGLYDPDRPRGPRRRGGGAETWESALGGLVERLRRHPGRVALLSDLQTGALAEVMEQFVRAFGSDRLLFYEPLNAEAMREANDRLFGRPVLPRVRLDRCRFVLSLSADFLETWISPVEYARDFAAMHAWRDGGKGRFVYVGPRRSMTAANADDVLLVHPGAEADVALAVLAALFDLGAVKGDAGRLRAALPAAGRAAPLPAGVSGARIREIARRLAREGPGAVLAGPELGRGEATVRTAQAAALLNLAVGATGDLFDFADPHALGRSASESQCRDFLRGLSPEDVLIVHQANPAFTLPAALDDIRRAGTLVALGTMADETAELADWSLPVDSPLESWGDYDPWAGVHDLLQPAMARLHDSRPAGDILLALAEAAGEPLKRPGSDAPVKHFEGWLRLRWEEFQRRLTPQAPFEAFWHDALRRGGVWESPTPVQVGLRPDADLQALHRPPPAGPAAPPARDALWVAPSIFFYDGRTANRGWLQEAPDPVSTIAWGGWVDLHPNRAKALRAKDGDEVEIASEFGRIRVPVRITDAQAERVVSVQLGQGHAALGRNARGRGANAFLLLGKSPDGMIFPPVALLRTGRRAPPAYGSATQDQHGRPIVQWTAAAALRGLKPGEGEPLILPLPEGYDPRRDLYPPHPYPAHRWAMTIDLDRCIGCGACAVACYAENNIPVMGEAAFRRGFEMAWLKVVPYRHPRDARRVGWLPLPCQHCDAAPCEPVCPVFAAVHNEEGLNSQIYNRCIGTRYCSNNCPYKVRRFNWLNVDWPETLRLQLNPDVSVRCRGVMEKCTFCVQRIREAEQTAAVERRPVRDGEIQPACVRTCPTRVFAFGDLLDPGAEVTAVTRKDPRRYHVLEELNTKSAVTYLRRIESEPL